MTARPMTEGERAEAAAIAERIANACDILERGMTDGPVNTDDRHDELRRYAAASRVVGEAGADGALLARALLSTSSEVRRLREALEKTRSELYWCAKQLEGHGQPGVPGDSVDVALAESAAALSVEGEDELARATPSAPISTDTKDTTK